MQLLRNFVFIAFLESLLVADGFGYQECRQRKCGVGNLRSALERAKFCVNARDPMPTKDTKQQKPFLYATKYVDMTKGEVSGISDYSIGEVIKRVNSPTSSSFQVKITFNHLQIKYDYVGSWMTISTSGKLKSTVKGSVVKYGIDITNGKYENGYVQVLNHGNNYIEFDGGVLGAFLEFFQAFFYDICDRIGSEIIKPEILSIVQACLPAP